MELESPSDRLQEVNIYLKMIGDHGNCDNSGNENNIQVVQKEEVTSMPMGPPPSRKMTRTPPVYQQVCLV